MERDARPAVATFHVTASLEIGDVVELSDAAAHHARVKRLEVGDRIRLSDGAGSLGIGALESLDKKRASVRVDSVQRVPPPAELHVRVPIGDRDRMLMLAEKVTELGVTSWQAVGFRRSMSVSPRGEGQAFGDKVHARMISALEQSGGAWLPTRLPDCSVGSIDRGGGATCLLLDREGEPLARLATVAPTVLLFGPEGGLESSERELLIANGWRPASLGENTLRFETAGVAAVAVVRAVRLANP